MAENKKSFVLYADLIATVGKLPDEIAGKLFKIVLEYVNDLDPTIDDLLLSVAFEPIKLQLKRDLKKYECKREQWSDAGKKSAEARRLAKIAADKLEKLKGTDLTDVENRSTVSTDNVNVNVNVIKENKQKKFIKPTIQEVRDYCKERKNSVNPSRFVDFYEAKGWKIGKNTMKDWRSAVRTWEQTPDNKPDNKKLGLNGSENF
jgi:hypothetical protein